MSRDRIESFIRSTRTMAMSTLVVTGLVLSACGPLGDDDSDPTATSETIQQPTTSATEEPAATEPAEATEAAEDGTPTVATEAGTEPSTPVSPDLGTPIQTEETEATTEVVSISTPALELDDEPVVGTPVTDGTPSVATPADDVMDSEEPTEQATEEESTSSAFSGSDGTSGATPESGTDEQPTGDQESEATPFFVPDDPTPEVASPVADATPVAPEDATLADLQPVSVTSCDPEVIPEVAIDQVLYLTTEDVNFRSGPGADCDLIATIGTNQEATLLGGPVTREEDDFVWAQVQIAGQTGWVVIEVLEPVG